jgi:hypothetical protein
MQGSNLRFFGIRHHGPGSARQLAAALEEMKPQALLIEWPADSGVLLDVFQPEFLEPPVALLQYDKKDFNRASFLPLALFSPEWVALCYAYKQGIPVYPMDLPTQITLCQDNFPEDVPRHRAEDPFALFALSMGQEDTEAWWENFFELEAERSQHFEVVSELIAQLRQGQQESEETLTREAFMRNTLRICSKKHASLAVICGAWHLPALENHQAYPAQKDQQRLKNLKKITLEAAWIPWSYQRLQKSSGYMAGVRFPAWYEWLFKEKHQAGARWLVHVNRYLRQQNRVPHGAAAAEAFTLALQLTALRQKSLPGYDELLDAQAAIMGVTREELSKSLDTQFLTGDKVGRVDTPLHQLPIQSDFESRVKSSRLAQDLARGYVACKDLDLRKPTSLKASALLHSLVLLGIPWGKWLNPGGSGLGNFKEQWELHWIPDYALTLMECGLWGNTLEQALLKKTTHSPSFLDEQDWGITLQHLFRCGLPELIVQLFAQLSLKLTEDRDLLPWLRLFPQLLYFSRYGDLRNTSPQVLETLLQQIFHKVQFSIGDYVLLEAEKELPQRLQALLWFHQALSQWENAPQKALAQWPHQLWGLAQNPSCPPEMKGGMTYMAWHSGILPQETLAKVFRREVGDSIQAENGSLWLYGFFVGQPGILLLNPFLMDWINQWLEALEEEIFQQVVPSLRKVFGSLASMDKQNLLELSQSVPGSSTTMPQTLPQQIAQILAENTGVLLGR